MATRRETMVKYLRGNNGFTPSELSAAFAVTGVSAFLTEAQNQGIDNESLADRLVAFKAAGGAGLANAIQSISKEFVVSTPDSKCNEAVEAIQQTLGTLQEQLAALIK